MEKIFKGIEIVGHQRIIQFLQKSIANDKLSHAYLFYGPEHIGKTAVAEYFVARLLCSKKTACGECLNCRQLLKQVHPDIYRVNDCPIGIDCLRRIISSLNFKPFFAPYKIAIIEQADNLTIQAANAFLKLLEQAPPKIIIILIAKSFYHLPATLRSRCQILRFCLPKRGEIIDFLKDKFALSKDKVLNIIDFALGRPGLAIEFAKDSDKLVQYRKIVHTFITLLSVQDFEYRFKLINAISDLGFSTLTNLLILLRNLILINLDGQEISFGFDREKLKGLLKIYSKDKLIQMCYQVLKTQFWLFSSNVNKRLAVENLLIQLSN